MKSFQTALTWGMATAIAAAAGCAPTARDFGDQGSANTSSGGNVGGAGGAAGSGVTGSAASQGVGASSSGVNGSTGSSNMMCVTPSGCNDNNICTKDICNGGVCLNVVMDNCCPHSICTVGPALNDACLFMDQTIRCATEVCKSSPSCCSTAWTKDCVESARILCSDTTGGANCMCAHSYCEVGEPLDPSCDPCVHAVCSVTPSCCQPSGKWSMDCVTETNQYCNIPLGANCQ